MNDTKLHRGRSQGPRRPCVIKSPSPCFFRARPCRNQSRTHPWVRRAQQGDESEYEPPLIDTDGAGKTFISPKWLTELGRLWGGKSVGRICCYAYSLVFLSFITCRMYLWPMPTRRMLRTYWEEPYFRYVIINSMRLRKKY